MSHCFENENINQDIGQNAIKLNSKTRKSLSTRNLQEQEKSLSTRNLQKQEKSLSTRNLQKQEKSLSTRNLQKQEKSLSTRNLQKKEKSLSTRNLQKQEKSLSTRNRRAREITRNNESENKLERKTKLDKSLKILKVPTKATQNQEKTNNVIREESVETFPSSKQSKKAEVRVIHTRVTHERYNSAPSVVPCGHKSTLTIDSHCETRIPTTPEPNVKRALINSVQVSSTIVRRVERLKKENKRLSDQSIINKEINDRLKEKKEENVFLEFQIQELTCLLKSQQEKIVKAYLHFAPEKELIKELIKVYLQLIYYRKKGIPVAEYKNKREEYKEIYNELKNKLDNEELEEEVEIILNDCVELVTRDLELKVKLSSKSLFVEEKKQLPQITISNVQGEVKCITYINKTNQGTIVKGEKNMLSDISLESNRIECSDEKVDSDISIQSNEMNLTSSHIESTLIGLELSNKNKLENGVFLKSNEINFNTKTAHSTTIGFIAKNENKVSGKMEMENNKVVEERELKAEI